MSNETRLGGPTVRFFCAVAEVVEKIYPDRACGPQLDKIRELLGEVENLYLELPVIEEKGKAKR